jgi:predicted ABC-type ATPase
LKDSGYSFNLFYFWLPTPDIAIERVRVRKLLGGHSVPEVDIPRRYRRGLQNFFDTYRPLAIAWEVYDNTQSDPRLIAAGDPETVEDAALWAKIETEASRGDSE